MLFVSRICLQERHHTFPVGKILSRETVQAHADRSHQKSHEGNKKTYLKWFIYHVSTLLFCVEGAVSGKENSMSSQKLSGKAFLSSQVIQLSSDKRTHMCESSQLGYHCQGISNSTELVKNRKNLCKPVLTQFPTVYTEDTEMEFLIPLVM